MPHSEGEGIGAYVIIGPLGAGGMGEVYRALDSKLGREVALKILPAGFAADSQRMARFEREAQVLASLNHPNIAAIYGLEESTDVRALVMELVEGPTLADKIHVAQGPHSGPAAIRLEEPQRRTAGVALQADEALPLAKQIAEALEYAHERGVIHRDLKPANIKITPEGTVKVLDFGLAKALDISAPSDVGAQGLAPLQNSPTLSVAATQAGVILGTAAYMSPEQARGKSVDRRTDIWAFGCVLFEMLSGSQAFEGETVSDKLAAVIRAEPEWKSLPDTVPAGVRRLLGRCLEKDPKRRLQAIGEARIAIEETLSGADAVAPGLSPAGAVAGLKAGAPAWRSLPWAVAGLIVGALASGLVVWRLAPRAQNAASMHFSAITSFSGVQTQPALSPDGRSVAFVSNRSGPYNIYVGLVSGGSLVQITNDPNLKSRPAWSPDGTRIAYARVNESGIWDVWEAPSLGGTPRRLILNATDPAWSPDGHSLAYENRATGTIWVSSDSGQNARQVTQLPPGGWHDAEPRFSPDGRAIAFSARSDGPYGELDRLDLATGKVSELTHDRALVLSPAWSPDSLTIYFASSRGGTMNIWKIAAGGGEPEQITSGQGDDAQLDVSSDGKRIVFSTLRANINIAQLDLNAKPGEQNVKPLSTDAARNQLAPAYSPDGKRLAYFSNLKGAEKEGIWLADSDGSNPLQLVQDDRVNISPRWLPDATHLVYSSVVTPLAPDTWECRLVAVSGGAPETIPVKAPGVNIDAGPDGRVLFADFAHGQIRAFDPRNNQTETLATIPANRKWFFPHWSPDGHSIAYLVVPSTENDPDGGVWVKDFKSPPRQVFRGWAVYFAKAAHNQIYLLQGKPDLNSVMWKVGWDGQRLARTSTTIRVFYYYNYSLENFDDYFDVSPDGSRLAFGTQEVLQSNIGMIDGIR